MNFQEGFNQFNNELALVRTDKEDPTEEIYIDSVAEYLEYDEAEAEAAWVKFQVENDLESGLNITLEQASTGYTYEGVPLSDVMFDICVCSWANGLTKQFVNQVSNLDNLNEFLVYIKSKEERAEMLEHLLLNC